MTAAESRAALYRTVWRWHFYAGLFVIPFILLLATTGAIYLFKPQLDRWEERDYRDLAVAAAVSPRAQVEAAVAAHPGSRFVHYRLPQQGGDAALVHLGLDDGRMRDVFVSPDGRVLGDRDPESTIAMTVSRIHGSLLLGQVGDWLVELAASWAIVMIASGLYLWWPRGRGAAGVVWPRISHGGRVALRDLHAVTGFWVAGLALVLLVSGLPWASVWGNALRAVRAEVGAVSGPADWKLRGAAPEHAGHDHEAMMRAAEATPIEPLALLDRMVANARSEQLAFPALVLPPGSVARHGPPGAPSPNWIVKSEAQNRPLVRSVDYDPVSGAEVSRKGFADKHPIDRLINYGIAWHEGALFGWVNQLIGLLTAAALLTLAVTSFLLWRRRRPQGGLGAPDAVPVRMPGVIALIAMLALLLPLLAVSLVLLLLIERLVLRRLPAASAWLGLPARA